MGRDIGADFLFSLCMIHHNTYQNSFGKKVSMNVLLSEAVCAHMPTDSPHRCPPALDQEPNQQLPADWHSQDNAFKIPNHQHPYTVTKQLSNYAGRRVLLLHSMPEHSPMIVKQTIIPEQASSSEAKHLEIELGFIGRVKELPDAYLTEMKQLIVTKEYVYNFMEYYCGGDLSRYRRGWGMLGTQERKEKVGWVRCMIRDVLLGLKRVHEMGYVFRDLKLQNVVISHEGRAKLCDFGLVAPIGSLDNSLCGTLECMPPERLNPKKRENPLHTSVDAWALGILTYELLMGTTPYKPSTRKNPEKSLLNQIYNGEIIMDDYVTEEGKAFISNLLQLNPHHRMDVSTALQHPFLSQDVSTNWWHCPCK